MKQPDVFQLISASGPFAEYGDRLMLFGQFIGSWDIDATWYDRNGGSKSGKGEWHFTWILGGRGIQDVLFASGAPPNQYGTTLRCYDIDLDAWHATWMQPFSGEFVHLIGRKVGDQIVLEDVGFDQQRRVRWSFTDITPESFLWHGEVTFDNGATWFLEQELRGRRRDNP